MCSRMTASGRLRSRGVLRRRGDSRGALRLPTCRLVDDHAWRAEVIRNEPLSAGTRCPGFDLDQPGPGINDGVDYHPDLRRLDRREGDVLPDFVIARHTAAGHCHPRAAVPVLHVKGSQTVKTESCRFSRLDRAAEVVL
jgi:hypothetical protein